MKTLVIHPQDDTTDFLSVIYADKDWTIVRNKGKRKDLKNAIEEHDRIIMLGHGTEYGLIEMYSEFKYHSVIDCNWVYLLREKECVCIWCNANVFVERYNLKGFYTGMIISEDMEANMYGVNAYDKEIDESNTLFANAIKNSIDSDDMLSEAKKNYTSDTNAAIMFNEKNLYTR